MWAMLDFVNQKVHPDASLEVMNFLMSGSRDGQCSVVVSIGNRVLACSLFCRVISARRVCRLSTFFSIFFA